MSKRMVEQLDCDQKGCGQRGVSPCWRCGADCCMKHFVHLPNGGPDLCTICYQMVVEWVKAGAYSPSQGTYSPSQGTLFGWPTVTSR
jgi:hypothetical protein